MIPPESLFRGKLTDEQLGIVLGQSKNHIRKKMYQIRNNPDYLIPLDILRQYVDNLICCYGNKAQNAINLIKRYNKLNDVPVAIYGVHR